MRIEVDQSGRIEDPRVKTVLAFSNGKSYAVLIPARVKREALEILRQRYTQPRVLYLKIFSAGLYLLLKGIIDSVELITIDVEYEGKDEIIKGLLLGKIRRVKPNFSKHAIRFNRVGKKPPAHHRAYKTYIEKEKPDRVIAAQDLLELL